MVWWGCSGPSVTKRTRARRWGRQSTRIRQALGRDVLVSRGNELAVAPDRIRCDAASLWDALDAGQAEKALELYRGPLLPGLYVEAAPAFEEWLEQERDRLRRAVLEAASAQSARLETEDAAAAVALLRRALEIAPEDEAALRRLLRILDARGDRAGALAAYEAFARRLARELDVEPAPETAALRDAIAGRAQLRAPAEDFAAEAHEARRGAPDEPPIRALAAVLISAASPLRDAGTMSGSAAAPASARWLRRPGVVAVAVAVVTLVIGAVVATRRIPAGVNAGDDQGRIVVAPFSAAVPDTGLLRLGRDLVVTLSASLDGLAGLQTADAHAALRHEQAVEQGAGPEAAIELARAFGAGRVLQGTLVRDGPGLRAEATLYRVHDGEAVFRVSARSPTDDVSTLTDSLAWAVLASLWNGDVAMPRRAGAHRQLPGPAALETRSLPALRAFLAGEQAIAEVRGQEAGGHFARAFALDSTYWFAYWRYGQIRTDWGQPLDPRIRATYEAHRHGFPERDRLLIEARMADSLSGRIALTQAVTRRFPDNGLAWFEYANLLVHDGPFVGTTRADAREAMGRALALSPADLVVLQHLFWMAAAEGDTAATGFVLRRTREVRAASRAFVAPAPDELDLFILVDALIRSGGDLVGLEPQLQGVVDPFVGYRGSIPLERVTMGPSIYGFHRAQLEIGERFLSADVPRTLKAAQMGTMAMTWAARGAWDSAMIAGARAAAAFPGPASALHMLRLTTSGEWLGALPAGSAEPWHAQLASWDDRLDKLRHAEIDWLHGVRAAAHGNRAALVDARQRLAANHAGTLVSRNRALPPALAALPEEIPRLLATSLAAFERALDGDVAGAADIMVELERQRAEQGWVRYHANLHPFLTAVDRIAAARWLRETGRAEDAATLLRWHEAVQGASYLAGDADAMLAAIVFYERARTEEANGRADRARLFDLEFLRHYDMPVPTHSFMIDRARLRTR